MKKYPYTNGHLMVAPIANAGPGDLEAGSGGRSGPPDLLAVLTHAWPRSV